MNATWANVTDDADANTIVLSLIIPEYSGTEETTRKRIRGSVPYCETQDQFHDPERYPRRTHEGRAFFDREKSSRLCIVKAAKVHGSLFAREKFPRANVTRACLTHGDSIVVEQSDGGEYVPRSTTFSQV